MRKKIKNKKQRVLSLVLSLWVRMRKIFARGMTNLADVPGVHSYGATTLSLKTVSIIPFTLLAQFKNLFYVVLSDFVLTVVKLIVIRLPLCQVLLC